MGNEVSSPARSAVSGFSEDPGTKDNSRFRSFPGSAILEKTFCGSIDTTDPSEYEDSGMTARIMKRAEVLCVSSPVSSNGTEDDNNSLFSNSEQPAGGNPANPHSAMFARALVSEVTDNPKTMKPLEMAAREKKLLRAQEAANRRRSSSGAGGSGTTPRPIGTPGGVGPPNVLGSLTYACTGDEAAANVCNTEETQRMATAAAGPPGQLQENRANLSDSAQPPASPYQITIGLALSRKNSGVGHPDTVTRQTAFDFNELQDRQYKYVSSTDQYGWRAGGGEPGGIVNSAASVNSDASESAASPKYSQQQHEKLACPDTVHIPIIRIDCPNAESVDGVISALASGEIFIPHMAITPEALSVSGTSPPDLVVRFGCERNDDVTPDEWPNWCLEFMHNQLYEYFYNYGARWMKRPFNITLARSVRWKTVKHMNRYFAHAEHVIDAWRERGPQYLDPQLSYIDGGATPEEVARPHGIYLFRGGNNAVPTNYFCPNFDPPYTTKMTRSLLMAVLGKSWDKKRREWTSEPIPRLVAPTTLMAAACGCTDPSAGGFMAKEVTTVNNSQSGIYNHIVSTGAQSTTPKAQQEPQAQQKQQQYPVTHSEVEFGRDEEDEDDDIREGADERSNHSHATENSRNHSTAEEKKSDEPSPHLTEPPKRNRTTPTQRYSSSTSMFSVEDEGRMSVAASGFDQSVAASGTTVMRTNIVSKRQPHSTEVRQLYSDEDWADDCISPQAEAENHNNKDSDDIDTSDPPGNKPSSPAWASPKRTVRSPNLAGEDDAEEETRYNVIEEDLGGNLSSRTTSSDESDDRYGKKKREALLENQKRRQNLQNTQSQMDRARGLGYAMPANIQVGKGKTEQELVEQTFSGQSLEYSTDGSSAMFQEQGSSNSLIGQTLFQQADGQSAGPVLSKGSHSSDSDSFFRSKRQQPPRQQPQVSVQQQQGMQKDKQTISSLSAISSNSKEDTESTANLSIQESASVSTVQSVIPSDEDLYNIGWAKALDPSSGNYYYFTLDRTKTVWENPLAVDQSTTGWGSEYTSLSATPQRAVDP